MSQWNIPPANEVLSDSTLSLVEAQELLLTAYTEEQDMWNKDVLGLEQSIADREKEARSILAAKDKWWHRVTDWLHIESPTQIRLNILQAELDMLHNAYMKRIVEMPNADRFELGMYVGKLFRAK